MTGDPGHPAFREVDIEAAVRLADAGFVVIDVRERSEWETGHVAGAVHLPLGEVAARIAEAVPDGDTPVLLHCAVGTRSALAATVLVRAGYTNVANLDGSVAGWRAHGGRWQEPIQLLTQGQQRRYARQVHMPEVGQEGQRRLLDAKVLLIGAGGLGSPIAIYLAALGVGTIGLVDDDVVVESNLQRQVLHGADRLGMRKVDSAELTLRGLNPETMVVKHAERMGADNVERLIGGYDVIVDGTDNLEARYVLNDAAVRLRKPVVHGSVYRWDGQVTTFVPFSGPCYRCMHPTPPPPELAPACSVAGVMGVLPGVMGMLQANEVVKLLLGLGETLAGRLLLFDGLGTRFDEVRVPRDPGCPACGEGFLAEPAQPAPHAGLTDTRT